MMVWAEVTVDGQTTPEFDVCNGLRQGCVIAPTLFNLYFALEMEQWGLTLSLAKTKLVVVVGEGSEGELRPLVLEGGDIESVEEFKYLGSVADRRGGVRKEVGERIARASGAFGIINHSILRNSNLSLNTKRAVYKAVVLGVLLYGSETWTTKRAVARKLEAFHNRCLRRILGITSVQQHL